MHRLCKFYLEQICLEIGSYLTFYLLCFESQNTTVLSSSSYLLVTPSWFCSNFMWNVALQRKDVIVVLREEFACVIGVGSVLFQERFDNCQLEVAS